MLSKEEIQHLQQVLFPPERMMMIQNSIVKAIGEGFKHTSPSRETADFMRHTELELGGMKKDIKHINDQMGDMSEKLEKFINSADQKYASKDTEVTVKRVGWLIITSVLVAVLALVIKT